MTNQLLHNHGGRFAASDKSYSFLFATLTVQRAGKRHCVACIGIDRYG